MNGLADTLVTGYLMEPPTIKLTRSRPRLEGELDVTFVVPEGTNERGAPIGGCLRKAVVRVEGEHAQLVADAGLQRGSAIRFRMRDLLVEAWIWRRRSYHKLVIDTALDRRLTFPDLSKQSVVRRNSFGKAVVTGHLEKDPTVKPAKDGKMAWAELRVAVPIAPYVSLDGEHVDGTHRFVTVKVFGSQAEQVAEIAPKRLDHVRVRLFDLRCRSWIDTDPETQRTRAHGTAVLIPSRGEDALVFTRSSLAARG